MIFQICLCLYVSPWCPTNWEHRKRGQLDGDEKGVWLYTTRHCGCHLLAMHTDTRSHPYAHTHTLFKTHIRQATAAVLTFRTCFLPRFQNVDINAEFISNHVTAWPANITCINPPLGFYPHSAHKLWTCVFKPLRIYFIICVLAHRAYECVSVCKAGHGDPRPLLVSTNQTVCTCLPGGEGERLVSCSTMSSWRVWWAQSYLDLRNNIIRM